MSGPLSYPIRVLQDERDRLLTSATTIKDEQFKETTMLMAEQCVRSAKILEMYAAFQAEGLPSDAPAR